MSNEMDELARAAFFITDVVKGQVGEFEIQENGWGEGDAPRCLLELRGCMALLDEEGWTRDDKTALDAPFTANIKRAVYKKKFPRPIGWRWVTITFAERFGIDCTITALDHKPWN